jgi:hypothetical protein
LCVKKHKNKHAKVKYVLKHLHNCKINFTFVANKNNMELGEKISEAQKESGMTVKAICRKCGYSRPTWYVIIKAKSNDFGNVNAESLRKTCELLKVKL